MSDQHREMWPGDLDWRLAWDKNLPEPKEPTDIPKYSNRGGAPTPGTRIFDETVRWWGRTT